MGVAALVLGIVSVIIGFIPLCGAIAFIPAIIGLILGIVDIIQKSKKKEEKGMAIAGVILTGIAIIVISFWILLFGTIFTGAVDYITTHQNEIIEYFNSEIDDWDDYETDWLDGYYSNYYERSL